IIGTADTVYLIEAKSSRSGETWNKSVLVIRDEQIRRHQALRWYLDRWRLDSPVNWQAFRDAAIADFESRFPTLTIAEERSQLRENLQFVLSKLAGRASRVV